MSYQFKIILIGPAAVGKTSLLHRFVHNNFSISYQMTMGADFLNKEVEIQGVSVILNIWDIGGQDRFKTIRKTLYRGASGAMLIFDLTRATTFQDIKNKWYQEFTQFLGKDIPFLLVGNKVDLAKDVGAAVESEKAKDFAENKSSIYIETSAKTGDNVEDAFKELARRVAEKSGIIIK